MSRILSQLLFENNIQDEKIYSFSLLLESRLEFIKKQHGNQYDSMIDHIAETYDPTANKKYTQWILKRTLAGETYPENLRSDLHEFDKASPKSHDRDINKHTFQTMSDVAHLSRTLRSNAGETGVKQIYDSNGVKAFHILDKNTMRDLYGSGRKFSANWCTSADSANNRFDSYSGNKYTIHYPNEAFMSFHHDSLQAKDPSNEEINFNTDTRYSPWNNDTRKIMEQTARDEGHDTSLPEKHFGISDEEFNKGWEQYKKSKFGALSDDRGARENFVRNIKHKPLTDEQFDVIKQRQHSSSLLKNPHLTDHQVSKLLDNLDGISYTGFQRHIPLRGDNLDRVVNHFISRGRYDTVATIPNLEKRHVDTLIDLHSEHNDTLSDLAHFGHYRFTDEQMDRINHRDPSIVYHISANQPVPDRYKDSFIRSTTNAIRNGYINPSRVKDFEKHNGFSDEDIHTFIDNIPRHGSGETVRTANGLLELNSIKQEHIDRLANIIAPSPYHPDAISNAKFSKKQVEDMMETSRQRYGHIDNVDLEQYINRRDTSATDVDKYNKFDPETYTGLSPLKLNHLEYYKKSGFTDDHFNNYDHAVKLMQNIEYQPKFTHHDISKILNTIHSNNDELHSNELESLLNHPNLNAAHLHSIIDNSPNNAISMYVMKNHSRTPPSVKQRIQQSTLLR